MGDVQALTNLSANITEKTSANMLAKIAKELAFLLNNLDSLNVTSINTSVTTVTSEGGTTTLDGGQMIMKDAAGTVRLIMGLNESNVFQFIVYNAAGIATLGLDSSGNIVAANASFSGTVSGTVITGGTVSGTAITGGTITGTTIIGAIVRGGLYQDESGRGGFDIEGHGTNFTDYKFYSDTYASGPKFEFYDELAATILKSFGTSVLGINGSGATPLGNWNFSGATVTNLTGTARFG